MRNFFYTSQFSLRKIVFAFPDGYETVIHLRVLMLELNLFLFIENTQTWLMRVQLVVTKSYENSGSLLNWLMLQYCIIKSPEVPKLTHELYVFTSNDLFFGMSRQVWLTDEMVIVWI